MALLTQAGMEDILKRIFETGEPTADMTAAMQRLKDDFDERAGILNKYGETYNGENKEYDFVESQEIKSMREDAGYREKYNDLSRVYYDRFFNGTAGRTQDLPTPELEQKDSADIEIDDFLYK